MMETAVGRLLRRVRRFASTLLRLPAGAETDHAAVLAMIGDFEGKRFREIPPDPRRIDPERVRRLRARLIDPYAYRWRSTEANGELVDALFHTIAGPDGARMGLGPSRIALDERGRSPPVRRDSGGRARGIRSPDYDVHHYITARSINVLDFITDYHQAVRLLDSLLPGCGFTIHSLRERTIVRLEQDGRSGPWIENGNVALALVVAVLEHLEQAPDDAQDWRCI